MDLGARRPDRRPAQLALSRRTVLASAGLGFAIPLLRPLTSSHGTTPHRLRTDLDADLRALMRAARVPGLAACIVRDGQVAWTGAYGWANIAHGRRTATDTIFMLASISKTLMATAVMQAVEDGLLHLDADVDDLLPFPVRNPRHPQAPISLRMLLTHTSSIRDDWPTIIPGYPDYPDGELRTTAPQLARHLLAFIGLGAFDGARILQAATVREMRSAQVPTVAHGQGLIWYRFTLRGMPLMGHNGGDSGVATQMYFRPSDGTGVIALANGNRYRDGRHWPLQQAVVRLFEEADRT